MRIPTLICAVVLVVVGCSLRASTARADDGVDQEPRVDYVGGDFAEAGGHAAAYIARRDLTPDLSTAVERERPGRSALDAVRLDLFADRTTIRYTMTPVSGADGVFETVVLDGNTVYRSAGTAGAYERYMYFRTDAEVQTATAYVEVTYLDVGYGDLQLQYNAAAADYQLATPLRGTYAQDTGGRRTAVFELPDAHFRDAQNLGTDLRVVSEPTLQKHLLSVTVYLEPPPSLPAGSLSTPAPSFETDSHIVSSTVFLWYVPAGGQLSGPWRPLEGRENWTGQTGWWTFQIKQMMRAHIDVIYVHYVPGYHQQRINLFQALAQLREEGWDVPKVAAWLDPLITWHEQPKIDLATEAGKDELAGHYIQFFEQYFSVNTDEHAEDYLAQIDGRPVLNTWHVHLSMDNVASLTREDLESRLQAALADEYPVFDNGIYMVTTALNPPFYTFADERVVQFEVNDYYVEHAYNGLTTVQLKGGYWDQNIRTPGDFLPRDGGSPYAEAWAQVDETVDRVYVESWNEYDEGTGIYAADTGPPFILPGSNNDNSDVWSEAGDPFEYIETTAEGAARWNEVPAHDARVLAHTLPDTMEAGETVEATITVRNEGDALWSGREGYRLAQVEPGDASFAEAVLVDDAVDDIPLFDGIFRGRPTTFVVEMTAPSTPGTYTTRWRMHGADAAFGEELEVATVVTGNAAPTAATITSPADGAEVVVGGAEYEPPEDPDAPFVVTWQPAADPDGDALTYTWQLATDAAFDEGAVLLSEETGAATRYETTLGALAALLDEQGMTLGSSLTLYHRILTSDGASEVASTVTSVTFVRGTLVSSETTDVPVRFALEAAYPNPFDERTTLRYALPQAEHVRLVVFDVLGRQVRVLVDGAHSVGRYEAVFEAAGLAGGIYFFRIEADDFRQTRRALLLE